MFVNDELGRMCKEAVVTYSSFVYINCGTPRGTSTAIADSFRRDSNPRSPNAKWSTKPYAATRCLEATIPKDENTEQSSPVWI